MNLLLENKIISEMMCDSNFSYIVHDNSLFLPTEYKVLQHQSDGCFVKCMKMLYDGNIQLYYITQGLKALSILLPSLDAESFMTIASNLIVDVIGVKNNGFLHCQNIDISFDRIYVDPTTLKVNLLYVPLRKGVFPDYSSFENELRTSLVRVISGVSTIQSNKTMQFKVDLSNGLLSLEDLYKKIKGGQTGHLNGAKSNQKQTPEIKMKLVALNAPSRLEIEIDKAEFVIGKKESMVDGLIAFNNTISRRHCKIVKQDNQFYVCDLQSANGTFINKKKLQPDEMRVIRNGDIIRLSNSDFQVVII